MDLKSAWRDRRASSERSGEAAARADKLNHLRFATKNGDGLLFPCCAAHPLDSKAEYENYLVNFRLIHAEDETGLHVPFRSVMMSPSALREKKGGNAIWEPNVVSLVEAMKAGWALEHEDIPPVIAIGTEQDAEIIDGHHRVEAARRLGIQVPVILLSPDNVKGVDVSDAAFSAFDQFEDEHRKKSGALGRWRTLRAGDDQAALIHQILGYINEDEIAGSGIAAKVTDFVWSQTRINPKDTNFGKDPIADTKQWLDEEDADYKADMGEPRLRGGERAKRREIEANPVIVIRGDDGVLWVLDGNHRTAQAMVLGIESIPAIVGVKKPGVGKTPISPDYKMAARKKKRVNVRSAPPDTADCADVAGVSATAAAKRSPVEVLAEAGFADPQMLISDLWSAFVKTGAREHRDHQITSVNLTGSRWEGRENPESDLDVVVFHNGNTLISESSLRFREKIAEMTGGRVDAFLVPETEGWDHPMSGNIMTLTASKSIPNFFRAGGRQSPLERKAYDPHQPWGPGNPYTDNGKLPAAACERCGGWSDHGGMSQFRNDKEPTLENLGRPGCSCADKGAWMEQGTTPPGYVDLQDPSGAEVNKLMKGWEDRKGAANPDGLRVSAKTTAPSECGPRAAIAPSGNLYDCYMDHANWFRKHFGSEEYPAGWVRFNAVADLCLSFSQAPTDQQWAMMSKLLLVAEGSREFFVEDMSGSTKMDRTATVDEFRRSGKRLPEFVKAVKYSDLGSQKRREAARNTPGGQRVILNDDVRVWARAAENQNDRVPSIVLPKGTSIWIIRRFKLNHGGSPALFEIKWIDESGGGASGEYGHGVARAVDVEFAGTVGQIEISDAKSWDPLDENVACKGCGRRDLPLHTDGRCPGCSKNAPIDDAPETPADVPGMKPAERQKKIDALLDRWSKEPEKRPQIEEQLKSLRATRALWNLRRAMPVDQAYHGTLAEPFVKFEKTNDIGFHFSSTPDGANERIHKSIDYKDPETARGARVMPVRLLIDNPYEMPDLIEWNPTAVVAQLLLSNWWDTPPFEFDVAVYDNSGFSGFVDFYDKQLKIIADRVARNGGGEFRKGLEKIMADKGYDGIVYHNDIEGGGDSYIVFDPNKIQPSFERAAADTMTLKTQDRMRVLQRTMSAPGQNKNDPQYLEWKREYDELAASIKTPSLSPEKWVSGRVRDMWLKRRAARAPDFARFRPDIASGWMNLLREHGVKETVPQPVVDSAVETSIENLMHSYAANGDGEDPQSFIAQWFDEDELCTFVALWIEHATVPVPQSLIAAAQKSMNWNSQITEDEVAEFNAGKNTGGERQSLLRTWRRRAKDELWAPDPEIVKNTWRRYQCTVCQNVQAETTNHLGAIMSYCKKCSWAPSKGECYNPMGDGRCYRKFTYFGEIDERHQDSSGFWDSNGAAWNKRGSLLGRWSVRRAAMNPDGTVDWDVVEALAEQARVLMVETNPDADHRPLSMCGIANNALANELLKVGVPVQEVLGVFRMERPGYGGGYDEVGPESYEAEHYWLEVQGKIVDIAADQFNEYLDGGPYPPVFIGTNDGRFVEQKKWPAKPWKIGTLKLANDPLKKTIEIGGVKIGIEWPKGTIRTWDHLPNNDYRVKMKADYGYIKGTEGDDGEEVDVYAGPNRESTKVFLVEQLKDDGSYDEEKYMLGYDNITEAKNSYLDHMEKEKMGAVKALSWEKFLKLVPKSQKKKALENAKEERQSLLSAWKKRASEAPVYTFDAKVLEAIAQQIRGQFVVETGECAEGQCEDLSEKLAQALANSGFESYLVLGYVDLDKRMPGGQKSLHAGHAWVEVADQKSNIIAVDITADQFNKFVSKPYPEILIGNSNDPIFSRHHNDEFRHIDRTASATRRANANPDKDDALFAFQDGTIEHLPKDLQNIPEANILGIRLENAGDIFRELVWRDYPDPGYIGEKTDKIRRHLTNPQMSQSMPHEALLIMNEIAELFTSIDLAGKSPILIAARDLNVALARQDLGRAATLLPIFDQVGQMRQAKKQGGTQELAAWLSGSAITRPVYHGTPEQFSVFSKDKLQSPEGFFFTTDELDARDYGDNIMTCYLSIKNPLEISVYDWQRASEESKWQKLISGHDGIHVIGDADHEDELYRNDFWIAFSPDQIRVVKNERLASGVDWAKVQKLMKKYWDSRVAEDWAGGLECSDDSDGLNELLYKAGMPAEHISGYYSPTKDELGSGGFIKLEDRMSHDWLVLDGKIIDITHSQFGKPDYLITDVGDPRYIVEDWGTEEQGVGERQSLFSAWVDRQAAGAETIIGSVDHKNKERPVYVPTAQLQEWLKLRASVNSRSYKDVPQAEFQALQAMERKIADDAAARIDPAWPAWSAKQQASGQPYDDILWTDIQRILEYYGMNEDDPTQFTAPKPKTMPAPPEADNDARIREAAYAFFDQYDIAEMAPSAAADLMMNMAVVLQKDMGMTIEQAKAKLSSLLIEYGGGGPENLNLNSLRSRWHRRAGVEEQKLLRKLTCTVIGSDSGTTNVAVLPKGTAVGVQPWSNDHTIFFYSPFYSKIIVRGKVMKSNQYSAIVQDFRAATDIGYGKGTGYKHGPECFCEECMANDDMSTHRCPTCGSRECPGDGHSIDCRKPGTMTLKDVPTETRDSLLDKFNKGEIDAETLRRRMKQITSSLLGRWRRRASADDRSDLQKMADQIHDFIQANPKAERNDIIAHVEKLWNYKREGTYDFGLENQVLSALGYLIEDEKRAKWTDKGWLTMKEPLMTVEEHLRGVDVAPGSQPVDHVMDGIRAVDVEGEKDRLLDEFSKGTITQTDLDQKLKRLQASAEQPAEEPEDEPDLTMEQKVQALLYEIARDNESSGYVPDNEDLTREVTNFIADESGVDSEQIDAKWVQELLGKLEYPGWRNIATPENTKPDLPPNVNLNSMRQRWQRRASAARGEAMTMTTERGTTYKITPKGEIVRLDIKGFEPSGQWLLVGIRNPDTGIMIPFKDLFTKMPKDVFEWEIIDYDHGTKRVWGEKLRSMSLTGNPPWSGPKKQEKPKPVRPSTGDSGRMIENAIIDLLRKGPSPISRDLHEILEGGTVSVNEQGEVDSWDAPFADMVSEVIGRMLDRGMIMFDGSTAEFSLLKEPEPTTPEHLPEMSEADRQQKVDALLDQLSTEKDPKKKKQIEQRLRSLQASVNGRWQLRRAGEEAEAIENRSPGAISSCEHGWPGKKEGERGWCGRCGLGAQ